MAWNAVVQSSVYTLHQRQRCLIVPTIRETQTTFLCFCHHLHNVKLWSTVDVNANVKCERTLQMISDVYLVIGEAPFVYNGCSSVVCDMLTRSTKLRSSPICDVISLFVKCNRDTHINEAHLYLVWTCFARKKSPVLLERSEYFLG